MSTDTLPRRFGISLGRRPGTTGSAWRQPLAIIGMAIAGAWILIAILAPVISPHDPLAQSSGLFQAPSAAHLFGTDELGRDVFSRVLSGARNTVPLAFMLVGMAVVIGSVLGALAGYFGGWIDEILMRLCDLVFGFPMIILAMAVTAALGPSLRNAVFAIVIVFWPSYARVVRGMVRSLGQADYVTASRLLGATPRRALFVDIMPNVAGPVMVLATLDLGNAVLLLSGLSFLGLGSQPPTAEWGLMVSTGAQYFQRWWIGTFPGLAILTVVLAFNFLGDSLRDALDPRSLVGREGREPMIPLLSVRGLRVRLPSPNGLITVVDTIDYDVELGKVFGLAGESGSGKTISVLALLGLLPDGAVIEGTATFGGHDLLRLRADALRGVRGKEIAMVFQDPVTALHPMLTVGRQITEHTRYHLGLSKEAARERALELLTEVRIPDAAGAFDAYPHQFSGGMRQRIAIASALACGPKLLIADEPTTALDVTVQAGILRLLDRLRRQSRLSVVMITHDLGVLSSIADWLSVMYAGRIAESGPTASVIGAPRHPYTAGLVAALPHPEDFEPLVSIAGAPPSVQARPTGCAFHPRCAFAQGTCVTHVPDLLTTEDGRRLACPIDPFAESA